MRGYLLDTNVISEHARSRPNPRVLDWLEALAADEQFLSVLTIGEIRKGIELRAEGPRREALRRWLDRDLFDLFAGRVLPVSEAVADRWGRVMARAGRTISAVDSLIAATALHHDLRLVTRNDRDFADIAGLIVVNPWTM